MAAPLDHRCPLRQASCRCAIQPSEWLDHPLRAQFTRCVGALGRDGTPRLLASCGGETPASRGNPTDADQADCQRNEAGRFRYAGIDERQCRLVELRFFGGLTVEEAAAALGIAPITVKRDWALARTWLYREMRGPAA